MEVLFWAGVFIVSLFAVVRGADWLLSSSERIGLAFGLSPFVVGVIIVGIGTSLPELVSSLFATFNGLNEISVANAVGSNIANILLVIGLVCLISGRLVIEKDLIDLDLPLLFGATILFLIAVYDRSVTAPEAIILLTAYGFYLVYTITHNEDDERTATILSVLIRTFRLRRISEFTAVPPKVRLADVLLLLFGVVTLGFGAKFLIDSVVELSDLLSVQTGAIALVAVAFGTSLPEVLVSLKAAMHGKGEMALGNIIGSSVFNLLVVVGIPSLITSQAADDPTFMIAVPFLIAVTLMLIISGITKRIHIWEGSLYLLIYLFFVGKVTQLI